jgi:predicted RNA-binding protein YlxR (DUF448 family)
MKHGKHTAERTCIGCREVRPSNELVRLVLAPDGNIVIDLDRRLPGRGANICPAFGCMEEAVRKDAFARAFRQSVSQPQAEDLADSICKRLEEKFSGLLGIGQRSRQVISGRMALEKGLERGRVHLLMMTEDIASDQRDRWLATYRSSGRPWVFYFTKERLGSLLGKELRSAVGFTHPKVAEVVYRLVSTIEKIEEERRGVKVRGDDESL